MHAPKRGMAHEFNTLAAGVDPAAHRYDPITRRNSDTWLEYVSEVYDPTMDDEGAGDGEVSDILGDAAVLEREPKDATEKRFTVRALPGALGASPTRSPHPPLTPQLGCSLPLRASTPPSAHAGLDGEVLAAWCRRPVPTHPRLSPALRRAGRQCHRAS